MANPKIRGAFDRWESRIYFDWGHGFQFAILNGYGSKLGTPKLWMVNTKLDISICGPINGLPF